jgi:hypothetical protein
MLIAVGALAITAAAPDARAPTPTTPPKTPLYTLNDLGAALRACWIPPPFDQARPGMQITVMFSFKRNGELFGQPRITFEAAGANDDERLAYRTAVAEMLKRCSPLLFTEALGNAVAGRPFTMRFIDNRKLKEARNIL